jgi:hypothetical protein
MTPYGHIRLAGAFALALLVLCQAGPSSASPGGEGGASPRAFVKGPYLQNLSAGGVTVCWETDSPSNATVLYGAHGALDLSASEEAQSTFHEVRLTGLVANATYQYLAVSGTERSAPSTFRTAPAAKAPFRFAVYGDSRTGHQNHTNIVRDMSSHEPAFVLNTGDLVESGADPADWAAFFGIIAPLANGTPYWPSLGNHDLPPDLYKQYFSLPGNEMYYSFDYGGAHFIALDSTGGLSEGSAQLGWLRGDLAASSASDWRFVFFHYPPYSSGLGHGSNLTLRALLDPLFVQYRVSAVFNGHDHDYEHADPKNGVQYFVTGGGGAPLAPSGHGDFTVRSESVFHHLIVDVGVDPFHTKVIAVREDGSVIEAVHLSNVPRPPSPPSGLRVANTTGSAVTVAWEPPGDPYLTGYNAAISENGSIVQEDFLAPATAHTFRNLSADRPYKVTVRALYRDMLAAPPDYASAPVAVPVRTAPAPPAPLSVRIIFPVAGTSVSENNTIFCRAEASGYGTADNLSVEWRLDGALLAVDTLNMSIKAGHLGDHTLAVRVSDGRGRSDESTVVFTVAPWHGGDPYARPHPPYADPPVAPFLAAAAGLLFAGILAAYLLAKRQSGGRTQ